jgi:CCR4-NOT transcription complex subunit 9
MPSATSLQPKSFPYAFESWRGAGLSKTVAIFIVQKILLDDHGLNYICATYERFYAVSTVLSNVVSQLVKQQTLRVLKHVVRCYLRQDGRLEKKH